MLQFKGISKSFRRGDGRSVVAMRNINFVMDDGAFIVLLGENGAGKSTFMDVASGVLTPDAGRVMFNGEDVTSVPAYRRAARVARIFQSRDKGLPQSMTVQEAMALAFEAPRKADRGRGRPLTRFASNRLEQLKPGLSSMLDQQMWHLSGGEHQLVALAIAATIASNHEKGHLLLLDEHVAHLDVGTEHTVMEATNRLIREHGFGAVMATHNCEIAAKYGDRQVVMHEGSIVDDRSGEGRISSASALRELLSEMRDRVSNAMRHGK